MARPTVGAVVCTYEESGHLPETIRRVYNVVDQILVLVGSHPWSCPDPERGFLSTYQTAASLFDPERKITVVTRQWCSEHEQRTYGKDWLFAQGIEWNMILDDDEFYNTSQIDSFIVNTLPSNDNVHVYLAPMHIYWKERDLILPEANVSYPVFVRTDPKKTTFHKARSVNVTGGNWVSSEHNDLAIHHLSYVRSDEHIRKKVSRFSHADEFKADWYEKHWFGWKEGQPAVLNHTTTHRVERLKKPLLTPCGYIEGSKLEGLLALFNGTVTPPEWEPSLWDSPKMEFLSRLSTLVSGLPVGSPGERKFTASLPLPGIKPTADFLLYTKSKLEAGIGEVARADQPYVVLPKWGLLLVQNLLVP